MASVVVGWMVLGGRRPSPDVVKVERQGHLAKHQLAFLSWKTSGFGGLGTAVALEHHAISVNYLRGANESFATWNSLD
jgi:hypothetical protein